MMGGGVERHIGGNLCADIIMLLCFGFQDFRPMEKIMLMHGHWVNVILLHENWVVRVSQPQRLITNVCGQ